jgi:hypothetical protein
MRPVESPLHGALYELIDGQQRLTTLLLFATAFRRIAPQASKSAIARFPVLAGAPRLGFAVRSRVHALLGAWAGLPQYEELAEKTLREDEYLANLASALSLLKSWLNAYLTEHGVERLDALGEFVFHRVHWVNNIMPSKMDLNSLFTSVNTGGMQLEQSDILKARLLSKVTTEQGTYDAIWQACERMDNYFERNLRQVFPHAPWGHLQPEDLARYSPTWFSLAEFVEPAQGRSIAELAASAAQAASSAVKASPDRSVGLDEGESDDEEDVGYCRSIIGFPLLLMHALRIYLRDEDDIEPRLSETRLNDSFRRFVAGADEAAVKHFVECLWQVRYQFDRHVVKWTAKDDDQRKQEQLRLSRVRFDKAKSRLMRYSIEISALSQLQSVRNFTGERSAQYWLTPFLGCLMTAPGQAEPDTLELLEDIDNRLSLATSTQKEASFALLQGRDIAQLGIDEICSYLRQPKSTAFEHYWFQKIEYLLWCRRDMHSHLDDKKFRTYRIASRNSVEHVNAQHDEYEVQLPQGDLHAFGNLVLLSPGLNSSYGNLAVLTKRAAFLAKPYYDSLKLAHIFASMGDGDWDSSAVARHLDAILGILIVHYSGPQVRP